MGINSIRRSNCKNIAFSLPLAALHGAVRRVIAKSCGFNLIVYIIIITRLIIDRLRLFDRLVTFIIFNKAKSVVGSICDTNLFQCRNLALVGR